MSSWYTDGTLDGRQWTLIRGSHVRTPDGDVALPLKHGNGAPENALYLRVAKDGSKFACVGNDDDLCWERVDGAWHDRGIAYGPQSVIYDNDGQLRIVPPPEAFGYRYVRPNNTIVTCTDSHFDAHLKIWDYTKLGDVFIGQGGDGPHGDDPCIAIEADGSRRLISEGRCRFINAYREEDQFAIYCVREDTLEAKRFLLTRQQISELPEIEADVSPVKPKPIPLEQVEPLTGKWLMCWYEQNGNCPPGKLPPGNAQVAVQKHTGILSRPSIIGGPHNAGITGGPIIGWRVGSESQVIGQDITIEDMERQAQQFAAEGKRPWFYWDSPIVEKIVQHTIPRWPSLPPGSVVELNAFCGRNESLEAYEREMRRYITEAAEQPSGYLLCLAVQTHTTNQDILRDPSQAIPPIIRLCQWARAKYGERFLGLNVFNNSGRDVLDPQHPLFGEGGLTANPQHVPHWTKVFSGVTGLPAVLIGNGGGGGNVLAIRLGPYLRKFVRGEDPWGLDVPWDIDSDRPIVKRRFQMNDGSVPKIVTHDVLVGADGRWERGVRYKPDRNGVNTFTVTMWDDHGNEASVTSEPITVTAKGSGGGGGPATIKEYKDYFAQRWRELGIDTQSQAIADREGFANLDKFEELNPDNTKVAVDPAKWDKPRYDRIAEECKAFQCPALIRIAGELHHQQGHRDVGLNVKENGNRWEDPRIPRTIATDILAVKPSDDAGQVVAGNFHIIDTMFAVGTPFTRPDYGSHGENEDTTRPWIEPPQP